MTAPDSALSRESAASAPAAPTAECLTPVAFLRRAAVVFAGRPAVVDGDVRLTYAQLWERCRRQAGLLRELGVQRGDRVAVLAPNSRLLLEAHYGVALAGGVLVTLNTRLTAKELGHIIEHCGPAVLLYHDSLADLAAQLCVGTALDAAAYERKLATAPLRDEVSGDENSMIALNYTSGTTGRPKGVMYHHRGGYLQALAMAYHAGITTSTVHLWTLPMFHCNGWAFTWAVTAGGGVHVCLPKVEPARVWQLIDDEGVNSLNAAPTVLIDLAAHPAAHRVDPPVRVGTGGAPPSPTLLDRLAALGLQVTHLYGLTETFGPAVVCEFPDEWYGLPAAQQ